MEAGGFRPASVLRVSIPGRRSIHERPQSVDDREQFGHWEGDRLRFRTQRGHLLTLCERVTSFTLAAPLTSKTAEATKGLLRAIFACLPKAARQSITFDTRMPGYWNTSTR